MVDGVHRKVQLQIHDESNTVSAATCWTILAAYCVCCTPTSYLLSVACSSGCCSSMSPALPLSGSDSTSLRCALAFAHTSGSDSHHSPFSLTVPPVHQVRFTVRSTCHVHRKKCDVCPALCEDIKWRVNHRRVNSRVKLANIREKLQMAQRGAVFAAKLTV
jgi:hypothetical protein